MNNDNQSSMVLGSVESTSNNEMTDKNTIENLGTNQVMNESVMMNEPNTNQNLNSEVLLNTQPLNNEQTSSNMVMDNIPLTEPTPQTPPPAYTNPQTINPMPNNNFQPQSSIGMTPPVSLEPEKQPKKKNNKTLFILLVLIALIGVGFGTYYVLNYTDLFTKKEEIKIETKNLEINLGESLPESITEYATITGTNISNCNPVDATEVNVNQGGVYKYTITCGNVSKIGTVTVIDNIEIVVETKTVYKAKGSTLTASEFAAHPDDGLKYDFAKEEDVTEALKNSTGTYTIGLKVTKGVKTVDATGKLVMLEYPIRGYVTCEANPQLVNSISATKVVASKFAILDDERRNSYAGFGYEINTFTFSDETIFNNYKDEYNEKNSISIDGVSGLTTFTTNDNGQSIITITKELDNSTVLLQYGADNMKDYSSIMKYFGKTANGLGYNCIYQKAE